MSIVIKFYLHIVFFILASCTHSFISVKYTQPEIINSSKIISINDLVGLTPDLKSNTAENVQYKVELKNNQLSYMKIGDNTKFLFNLPQEPFVQLLYIDQKNGHCFVNCNRNLFLLSNDFGTLCFSVIALPVPDNSHIFSVKVSPVQENEQAGSFKYRVKYLVNNAGNSAVFTQYRMFVTLQIVPDNTNSINSYSTQSNNQHLQQNTNSNQTNSNNPITRKRKATANPYQTPNAQKRKQETPQNNNTATACLGCNGNIVDMGTYYYCSACKKPGKSTCCDKAPMIRKNEPFYSCRGCSKPLVCIGCTESIIVKGMFYFCPQCKKAVKIKD